MSERLFWPRSGRHMVPPLIPLTTYAPLPPALVTAQQTFPVFVQILEEKKGWLPAAILLNFMVRLGSLMVGSLLFSALSVFQYVFWFCWWSQGESICCCHSCCLCSSNDWVISWLSIWICGWFGAVFRRWFLSVILVRMCWGMGFVFLLILPLGMYSLSAWMIMLVIASVSWCILSVGGWFLSCCSM